MSGLIFWGVGMLFFAFCALSGSQEFAGCVLTGRESFWDPARYGYRGAQVQSISRH